MGKQMLGAGAGSGTWAEMNTGSDRLLVRRIGVGSPLRATALARDGSTRPTPLSAVVRIGQGSLTRPEADHALYLECFRQVLERCDPNVRHSRFGRTVLHDIAASDEAVSPEESVAFATMVLNAGARVDERDDLLRSTPLGWACRWGRIELVKLLIERGADPVEANAEPWATPRVWAVKMRRDDVLAVLLSYEH